MSSGKEVERFTPDNNNNGQLVDVVEAVVAKVLPNKPPHSAGHTEVY